MTRDAAPAAAVRGHARALADSISRELDGVRALRRAVAEERAAVERVDADGLRRAAGLVADRSRTLADAARARDRIAVALGLSAGASIEALAARLRESGEDARAIEQIGGLLRTEAAAVAREVAVVRNAAERLAAHLAGVRSLITAPAGGVYGRRGRLASNERALTVDLRH